MRIRRTKAQMKIESKDPTMHLNRAPAMQMLNIGPIMQAARAYYQKAYQNGIDNIGSIVSDGNAMMQIGNNAYSLADIAAQQSMDNEGELTQSMMPPPEIEWDSGYFNVNWSSHSMEMEWDVSSWADIRVEPGYVEIRMAKYPSIVIRVKYDESEKAGGKLLDKYV